MGQRSQPGEHVAQFVALFGGVAFAHGLGELTDLLAEPCHRRRSAACLVSFAVGLGNDGLELIDLHEASVRSPLMPPNGPLSRLKAKVTASLRGRPSSPSKTAAPDRGTKDGGIIVSYAPERDGDADPGEVVWAWVPFEDDPTQGKDRPVLVLGWDGKQLAAVQLSSKDHSQRSDANEWVPVGTGAWDREARPSYADASRLLRFNPSEVRREGAALDEQRFETVLARVRKLHDWQG